MGIEEELGAIWGHLDTSAQQAAVDKALAELDSLPPAVAAQACAAVGVDIANKRKGAEIIAAARALAAALAPLGIALL